MPGDYWNSQKEEEVTMFPVVWWKTVFRWLTDDSKILRVLVFWYGSHAIYVKDLSYHGSSWFKVFFLPLHENTGIFYPPLPFFSQLSILYRNLSTMSIPPCLFPVMSNPMWEKKSKITTTHYYFKLNKKWRTDHTKQNHILQDERLKQNTGFYCKVQAHAGNPDA